MHYDIVFKDPFDNWRSTFIAHGASRSDEWWFRYYWDVIMKTSFSTKEKLTHEEAYTLVIGVYNHKSLVDFIHNDPKFHFRGNGECFFFHVSYFHVVAASIHTLLVQCENLLLLDAWGITLNKDKKNVVPLLTYDSAVGSSPNEPWVSIVRKFNAALKTSTLRISHQSE